MKFIIHENLAKLNEHDNSNRNNRFGGAALKKKMTGIVEDTVRELEWEPIDYPVMIGLTWYYSGRHDFDNIRFAVKYVLDGIVKAGLLPNDNQNWVKGFLYDKFIQVPKGEDAVGVEIQRYEQ